MSLFENVQLLSIELLNTLYMVIVSSFFAAILGLPMGVVLTLTGASGLKYNSGIYKTIGTIVNIGRSIPFAILMIALIPFTRLVIGTSIGTTAAIVPLTIAAAPFFARLVETALKKVDYELTEAALVMGANTKEIVQKILLPESLPMLVASFTTTVVNLIGYSAMAGLVGGGGLGKVAIQYGYQRFNASLMLVTLVLLLILVEIAEWIGKKIVRSINCKRGRA